MKYFNLSIATLIVRFYLMMLVVIAAFATQTMWMAILALPIFLSCMMGIKFGKDKKQFIQNATAAGHTEQHRHAA